MVRAVVEHMGQCGPERHRAWDAIGTGIGERAIEARGVPRFDGRDPFARGLLERRQQRGAVGVHLFVELALGRRAVDEALEPQATLSKQQMVQRAVYALEEQADITP